MRCWLITSSAFSQAAIAALSAAFAPPPPARAVVISVSAVVRSALADAASGRAFSRSSTSCVAAITAAGRKPVSAAPSSVPVTSASLALSLALWIAFSASASTSTIIVLAVGKSPPVASLTAASYLAVRRVSIGWIAAALACFSASSSLARAAIRASS